VSGHIGSVRAPATACSELGAISEPGALATGSRTRR
jgi:hypothetical protein